MKDSITHMPKEYSGWTRVHSGRISILLLVVHERFGCTPLTEARRAVHDFDELIGFFGSNQEDPYDLGGVVEIGIGGEMHRITRSTLIFVPAGLKHLPLSILEVKRPIFHFTVCLSPFYSIIHTDTGEKNVLDQPRD